MRFGSMIATLFTAALGSGLAAPAALAQSQKDDGLRRVTFELTSLTRSGLPLQHGIRNFVTLSMVEVGGSQAIRIDEPPAFPLIATLTYYDREGVEREKSFSYDYRC